MKRMLMLILSVVLLLSILGCEGNEWENDGDENYYNNNAAYNEDENNVDEENDNSPDNEDVVVDEGPPPPPEIDTTTLDKWSLWTNGTQLRGVNIYQTVVVPELDGLEFKGPGPVGPPFVQEDFERLAALGVNYVNISHPGLYTEKPPYQVDEGVVANLDRLLEMIQAADMFAVISFRTGPGRAEWGLCCLEEAGGDWLPESYLNDDVWVEQAAQDAWVEMWRYTAERYQGHPIVVGYDLMVEPNSNEVWLDEWEPDEFYDDHSDTLYDWNPLFHRITAGIREVDNETPIIVGGMSYSDWEWFPYIEPSGDARTIYAIHQYSPHRYTHQYDDPEYGYPGELDLDWDGRDDDFDQGWLADLVAEVDEIGRGFDAPVVINEYGLVRWMPGGVEFIRDEMALFEMHGFNYAIWAWEPAWEPWTQGMDAFNLRFGTDPGNKQDDMDNELLRMLMEYWARNTVRPSDFYEE